jgi:hypothetical protein
VFGNLWKSAEGVSKAVAPLHREWNKKTKGEITEILKNQKTEVQ